MLGQLFLDIFSFSIVNFSLSSYLLSQRSTGLANLAGRKKLLGKFNGASFANHIDFNGTRILHGTLNLDSNIAS